MIESALVWLTAFAVFVRTLCPALSSGDTGELFLAGRDLDITHPPGYPVLAMLIRLALSLPVGGLMFRAGLVAAASGAFAVLGVWRLARRFGAGRIPAALAAGTFATLPLVWWQSTMLEKYALQMALVPPVLLACLAGRVRLAGAAWLAAIALAHHAIAVFLAPAWFLAWWRSPGRRSARASLVAVALVALPLSIKPVYTAVRSRALHDAERAGVASSNWCEPYQARAWLDYLRVRYYAARFGAVDLEHARLPDHLRYYAEQFGLPLLAAGLAGLVLLVRLDRRAGGTLFTVLAVSAVFNSRFILPRSLAAVYHQDAFLILSLGLGLAVEALRRVVPRPASLIITLAAAGLAGVRAERRAAVYDASRHFGVFDYNRAQLAPLPRGAVFLASFDYDMFAARWFQAALGWREDLTALQVPFRVYPGQFVVRRRYRPWAAALLPGARLEFTDDDEPVTILRRIVADNARTRCFALSGLSEPALLPDLFENRGPVFVARIGPGGPGGPDRALRALRAGASRSWYAPDSALPVHAIVLETWSQAHWYVAAGLRGTPWRLALLRARTRLIPGQATAWLGLGAALVEEGRPLEGIAAIEKARALEPDNPDAWLALLRLQTGSRSPETAAATLRLALARPGFAALPGAAVVRAGLDRGDAHGAVEASHRWFAEIALDAARALRGNPENDPRKVYLYRVAADLAPAWAEAQAQYVSALQIRGRHAEAVPYLDRLRRLDPSRREPVVTWAAALLTGRRFAEAKAMLAPLVRTDPRYAPGWFYLGQVEFGLGNRRAAADAFRTYLALEPNSPQATVVRQAVERLADPAR